MRSPEIPVRRHQTRPAFRPGASSACSGHALRSLPPGLFRVWFRLSGGRYGQADAGGHRSALMNPPAARLPFLSGGVAGPALTPCRIHSSFVHHVPLAGRIKRLFTDGVCMRADSSRPDRSPEHPSWIRREPCPGSGVIRNGKRGRSAPVFFLVFGGTLGHERLCLKTCAGIGHAPFHNDFRPGLERVRHGAPVLNPQSGGCVILVLKLETHSQAVFGRSQTMYIVS